MGHPRDLGGPGGLEGTRRSGPDDLRRDLTAAKRRYVKTKLSIMTTAGAIVFFILSSWRFLLIEIILCTNYITTIIFVIMGLVWSSFNLNKCIVTKINLCLGYKSQRHTVCPSF